jgi:hypothetical protein
MTDTPLDTPAKALEAAAHEVSAEIRAARSIGDEAGEEWLEKALDAIRALAARIPPEGGEHQATAAARPAHKKGAGNCEYNRNADLARNPPPVRDEDTRDRLVEAKENLRSVLAREAALIARHDARVAELEADCEWLRNQLDAYQLCAVTDEARVEAMALALHRADCRTDEEAVKLWPFADQDEYSRGAAAALAALRALDQVAGHPCTTTPVVGSETASVNDKPPVSDEATRDKLVEAEENLRSVLAREAALIARHDARTAELEGAMADAWQPIETAPRTSKAILLWVPEVQCAFAVTWHDRKPGFWPEGWAIFGGDWRDHLQRATHWMPLPPAPALRALERGQ